MTGVEMSTWVEAEHQTATFLAIVPPDDVSNDIVALQRQCGITPAVSPHITVKGQAGLKDLTTWPPLLRDVIAATKFMRITLGPVDAFGDGIIFLRADCPELLTLHRRIIDALASVGVVEFFEYEGDAFVPHVTIGAEFAGATPDQLQCLRKTFASRTWPPFIASTVTMFHRSEADKGYMAVDSWPMNGAVRTGD